MGSYPESTSLASSLGHCLSAFIFTAAALSFVQTPPFLLGTETFNGLIDI